MRKLRHPDGSLWQFMPRVNGVPFRCKCGANVLHKPDETDPDLYECNGCGQLYEGEDA